MRRNRTVRVLLVAALAWPGAAPALFLAFTPDPDRSVGVSPEGCYLEPGPARGALRPDAVPGTCHSGTVGGMTPLVAFVGDTEVELPPAAEFLSPPFEAGLALAGPAALRVYYINPARQEEAYVFVLVTGIDYVLEEIRPDGTELELARGEAIHQIRNYSQVLSTIHYGLAPLGESATFDVGPQQVAAGSRLRLSLRVVDRDPAGSVESAEAIAGYLLFGGRSLYADAGAPADGDFSDAGITLETAEASKSGPLAAGAFPAAGAALLLLCVALRRRTDQPRVRAKSFM